MRKDTSFARAGRCFLQGVLIFVLIGACCLARAAAQGVILPDGRVVEFSKLPFVEKFGGAFRVPGRASPVGWISIMTTLPFCPSAWHSTTFVHDIDQSTRSCTKSSQDRLVDYDESARSRCQCVKAVDGPSPRSLKAVHEVVNDRFYYTNLTLFVTRGTSRQKLRGFLAYSRDGDFQISNDRQQLICAGGHLSSTGVVNFSCFEGRTTAAGSYRLVQEKTSVSSWYGLGSFQLSDGSRLDIASNIVDRDLVARHPNFPD